VKQVALVSAFGRGNWLASELKSMGYSVHLLDVTSNLGRWTPEDREGPFGFYHTKDLRASQLERIVEEDYLDEVKQGLTLLLKRGPLELKSQLNFFWLENLNVSQELRNYVFSYASLSSEKRKKLLAEVTGKPFAETWFLNLAHQLASNVYKSNEESYQYGEPTPCFSTLSVRRASRRGYDKSLEWCESKGISVYRKASIKDISIDKKHCIDIEYQSEKSGALTCDHYIWMLSSEETEYLNPKISRELFPSGVLKSEWTWTRYRFNFSEGSYLQSLPQYFVIIEDLNLPWTHENLCIVEQTVKETVFDIWVRIPTIHRFQKSYIEELSEKVSRLITDKLPYSSPQLLDPPQEYLYNFNELGPGVFPVYNDEEFEAFKPRSIKNMFFNGPEKYSQFTWNNIFKSQEKILDYFVLQKQKEVELLLESK